MVTAISRNWRRVDDDEEIEKEKAGDRMSKGGYYDETSEIDRGSHYSALLHRKFSLSDG